MKQSLKMILCILALAPLASMAAQVSITHTADNVLTVSGVCLDPDCNSPSLIIPPGPNAGDWRFADTALVNLEPGIYELAFDVPADFEVEDVRGHAAQGIEALVTVLEFKAGDLAIEQRKEWRKAVFVPGQFEL